MIFDLLNWAQIYRIIVQDNISELNKNSIFYFYTIADVLGVIEYLRKHDNVHTSLIKIQNEQSVLHNDDFKDISYIAELSDEGLLNALFVKSSNGFQVDLWSHGSNKDLTPIDNLALICLHIVDSNWETSLVDKYLDQL